MRNALRFAGACVAACLTLSVVVVAAPPVGAATLADAGWWWRTNPGTGTSLTPPGVPQVAPPAGTPETPPPPDVPDGGLLVERAVDGSSAIGAVRFTMTSSEANPTLELKAKSTAGSPALLACQTGSAWSGADGGRWDSKPLVACDPAVGGASVSGVVGEGGVWTFNLSQLVLTAGDAKEIDIAIVPQAQEGAGAPFRIVFDPVTAASLKTELGGTSGSDFSFGDSLASEFAFGGEGALGGTDLGSFDSSLGAGSALAQPDLPAADQGLSATAPAVRNQTLPAAAAPIARNDSTATTVAVGVILMCLALAYVLSQRRMPMAHGLIPVRSKRAAPVEEAVRVGGLGRFARPRVTAPIRLG